MAEKSRSWKFVSLGVLITILAVSGYVLFEFLDVILLSLAVSYLASPLARKMYSKTPQKDMRYLISCVLAVTIVSAPFVLATLYGFNYLLHWFINNLPSVQSGYFAETLKVSFKSIGFGVLSERIAAETGKLVLGFSTGLSNFITKPTWLVDLILRICLFFLTSFYMLYEGPAIKSFILKNVPTKERFLQELMISFDKICYGLFVGHFFTSLIITITFAVLYWAVFQVSIMTVVFLTIIMFVASFIPVLGPWALYIPLTLWHLIMLQTGIVRVVIFFALCVVLLTMIPDFYLRPMFVKREEDIHPLLIIFGFFGGPMLFGIKGVIIGPLMLGLAQAILRLYIEKRHILKDLIEHF